MKNLILTVCGCILLALAAVGIFVPVLPTTPFVLVASACFSVANPRLRHWLEHNRAFGPLLLRWRTGEGLSKAHRIRAIALLWASLAISAIASHKLWVTGLLAVIGVCVTVHLLVVRRGKAKSE